MREVSTWIQAIARTTVRECREWTFGEFFFCAIMPLFWVLVVWALLGDGVMTKLAVAFVDDDKSPMSREVARAFEATRTFRLIHISSREKAMRQMRQGTIYGVLAVPFAYSRDMLNGLGSSVILYVDENRYAIAGTLQADASAVMSALSEQGMFAQALRTGVGTAGVERILEVVHSEFYAMGNMQFSFLAFLGASLIPGVIMVGAMLGFVIAFVREDRLNKIAEWLACADYSVSAAITAKLLPHYALYCFFFLFYIALFCGYGGFHPAGSIFLWFACGACCLAVFAAMAVLIAGISPNWRLALVLASGYAAPALPYTGFSIPLDSMSEAARIFGQCLPLTWLIQGQAQQWTLGASLSNMGTTFLAFGILFILPASAGYFIFRAKISTVASRDRGART